jgi:hypothetical protein
MALDMYSRLSCREPDFSFEPRAKVTAKVTKYIYFRNLAITSAPKVTKMSN